MLQALSKALTEDELIYLSAQFNLLEPKDGCVSLDNFKMVCRSYFTYFIILAINLKHRSKAVKTRLQTQIMYKVLGLIQNTLAGTCETFNYCHERIKGLRYFR